MYVSVRVGLVKDDLRCSVIHLSSSLKELQYYLLQYRTVYQTAF